jgi:hypothetical protein
MFKNISTNTFLLRKIAPTLGYIAALTRQNLRTRECIAQGEADTHRNHGEEEEATADDMNMLPLHDSEGGGGGLSSRSQGLPGPTTACEAQQATASIAAPPLEKNRPGHAGSSRNGSPSWPALAPLLPCIVWMK